MIFQMDLEIKKEKINDKEYIDQLYQIFCKNYINQIKDKLNFNVEMLTIDDPRKKEKKSKDQLKENPDNLKLFREQAIKENSFEENKINIIRYKMEMVNLVIKKDMREKTKKPHFSRPDISDKVTERKSKRPRHGGV